MAAAKSKHKRKPRKDSLDWEEEPLPPSVYKAQADTLAAAGNHTKAIQSYSKAIELLGSSSSTKSLLVARSKCHLHLQDHVNALKDVDEALKEDPLFFKALHQKAETQYFQGDFEQALIFYHRGQEQRPGMDIFRIGIQKTKESLDNGVGIKADVKLTTEGDLSYFKQPRLAKDQNPQVPAFLIPDITDIRTTAKKSPSREIRGLAAREASFYLDLSKKNAKRWTWNPKAVRPTAKVYQHHTILDEEELKEKLRILNHQEKNRHLLLEELYEDSVYIRDYLSKVPTKSKTDKDVYDLLDDGLKYLHNRSEFWLKQNPYISKRAEVMSMVNRNQFPKGDSLTDYLLREIERTNAMQQEGLYRESIQRAKDALAIVTSPHEKVIKSRVAIECSLYDSIGNAHYDMKHFKSAKRYYTLESERAVGIAHADIHGRALDNIGRCYARLGLHGKAIAVWQERVVDCANGPGCMWLHHEIGRCYFEKRNYRFALDHAKEALIFARRNADIKWQINVYVLMGQILSRLNLHLDAHKKLMKAINLAQLNGFRDAELAIIDIMENISGQISKKLEYEQTVWKRMRTQADWTPRMTAKLQAEIRAVELDRKTMENEIQRAKLKPRITRMKLPAIIKSMSRAKKPGTMYTDSDTGTSDYSTLLSQISRQEMEEKSRTKAPSSCLHTPSKYTTLDIQHPFQFMPQLVKSSSPANFSKAVQKMTKVMRALGGSNKETLKPMKSQSDTVIHRSSISLQEIRTTGAVSHQGIVNRSNNRVPSSVTSELSFHSEETDASTEWLSPDNDVINGSEQAGTSFDMDIFDAMEDDQPEGVTFDMDTFDTTDFTSNSISTILGDSIAITPIPSDHDTSLGTTIQTPPTTDSELSARPGLPLSPCSS